MKKGILLYDLRRSYYYIAELVESTVKWSILIGSLSGLNFAIRTTKLDRSRTNFIDL